MTMQLQKLRKLSTTKIWCYMIYGEFATISLIPLVLVVGRWSMYNEVLINHQITF